MIVDGWLSLDESCMRPGAGLRWKGATVVRSVAAPGDRLQPPEAAITVRMYEGKTAT